MAKKKIYRSGVIPYYIKDGEILMLFMKPSKPKFGGDVFQIAKGKHEKGESALEAGMREANEELGLFSGNVNNIHELGEFLGRTTMFVAEIEDPDKFGDPHFETSEVKWMSPEEFQKEGRDLHKPVVKAAVRWIKKQDKSKIEEQLELLEYFNISLYEMSNFNANSTGLTNNCVLWVRTEPTGLPHTKFRFKVTNPQKGDAVFGFWGDEVEQVAGKWNVVGDELKRIQALARINKDALISHINGKIDSSELANALMNNKEQVLKG